MPRNEGKDPTDVNRYKKASRGPKILDIDGILERFRKKTGVSSKLLGKLGKKGRPKPVRHPKFLN